MPLNFSAFIATLNIYVRIRTEVGSDHVVLTKLLKLRIVRLNLHSILAFLLFMNQFKSKCRCVLIQFHRF